MSGDGQVDEYAALRARLLASEVRVRGRRYYVAEQDVLLDDAELTEYIQRHMAARERPDDAPAGQSFVDREHRLLARTRGGRVLRWRDGLMLSYSVAKDTFDDGQYELVVSNMRSATAAWQDVCGIRFEHLEALDDTPSDDAGAKAAPEASANALFTVLAADMDRQAFAVAFYPDDPPEKRSILIDPSYFGPSLPFNDVGVLRHELGHVLGFRHEHIRGGSWVQCAPEPMRDTQALTAYDSKSVMHYLCDGIGSPALDLTEVDIEGAQLVYGPPFGQFELVS